MSVSTATFARTQVFDETETRQSRLSPVKSALLVGVQVLLVVVCMAVVIREIVAMDESSETSMQHVKESSGTGPQIQEHSRVWAGAAEQAAITPQKKVSEDDSSLPDCMEETGKTKLAKAVWVFIAGALLQSDRSRSIIVAATNRLMTFPGQLMIAKLKNSIAIQKQEIVEENPIIKMKHASEEGHTAEDEESRATEENFRARQTVS